MPRILGIDEVGRGPWAGPLVVGAVILGEKFQEVPELKVFYDQFTDSKKLSEKKRTQLAKIITEHADFTGLGWVAAAEIDTLSLSPALKLAARRALKGIKVPYDEIVIDGTINLLAETPYEDKVVLLKKADLLVKEVSAASIIAKVARDNYMAKLAETYPEYGFHQHVGYGTAAHQEALKAHGPCPEHRKSFRPVAALAEPVVTTSTENNTKGNIIRRKNTTKVGQKAEQAVAEFLEETHDHEIIVQNFRTRVCEIDLISVRGAEIYFTEVKYRQNSQSGDSFEQITPSKVKQMQLASQEFLQQNPRFGKLIPHLAAAGVSGPDYQIEDWFVLD